MKTLGIAWIYARTIRESFQNGGDIPGVVEIPFRRHFYRTALPTRAYLPPDPPPAKNDLAAVCSYFNPCHYRSRRRLYDEFISAFQATAPQVPLLTVELAFGNALFELSPGERVLQLRTRDVMWQKERLLNIGIAKLIQTGYRKIAWLDADIIFDDPHWPSRASLALDEFPLCQLFAESVRPESPSGAPHVRRGVACEFRRSGRITLRGLSCGYAWAARAEILEAVPLFDAAILGSGDAAIWLGSLCAPGTAKWENRVRKTRFFKNLSPAMRSNFHEWAKRFGAQVEGRVGFLPQTLHTLYHGKTSNRLYGKRYRRLRGLDPAKDLRRDGSDCWSWWDERNDFREKVESYFAIRQEDDGER